MLQFLLGAVFHRFSDDGFCIKDIKDDKEFAYPVGCIWEIAGLISNVFLIVHGVPEKHHGCVHSLGI